jgi:iron complex transport system substrate-binding protein
MGKRALTWWIPLVIFLLSGLGLAQYPKTLRDDLGRQITLKTAPQRLVSMIPSASETLCALGVCGRLVGVDTYSNWPPELARTPKVGSLFDASPERIVALKPDLVVVSIYSKLHEVLEQAGVATFAVNAETYDDIFRTTLLLGEVVGTSQTAQQLAARVKREVYQAETRALASQARPSVYLEIDPTPYSAGPDSFLGILLSKARGLNIVPRELGLFPQISPELVLQRNPQVIVVAHPQGGLPQRPGWNRLRAVQNNRICSLTPEQTDLVSRPGPRVAQAIDLLYRCIHSRP